MDLVEIDCPVCESSSYHVLYPDTLGGKPPVFGYKWTPEIRKSYRYVRCESCSHGYSSPRPESLFQFYEDVADDDYLKNKPLREETAGRVLETIRQYMPSGRLVDIGCSTGDFLSVARETYTVEGVELSTWAVRLARAKDIEVHQEMLDQFAQRRPAAFDVATLWGVIEHVEFPREFITHVKRLLKPGGLVCFWTGDLDSIYAKVMGRYWLYILGQHLHLFSRRSLDHLMRDAGFEKIHNGIYPYVISFEYLGISLSRYPVIGPVMRGLFKLFGLNKKELVIKKSDEIFAIYKKVTHVGH